MRSLVAGTLVSMAATRWPGTVDKDRAAIDWCARITAMTGQPWRFARIDQGDFKMVKPQTLADLVGQMLTK